MSHLAYRLRSLIEDTDKKQKDIASALGISQQRFNAYVLGKREPDVEILGKIATYFNVSIDYLTGHSPNTEAETRASDIELQQLEEKYLMLPKDMRTDAIRYIDYLISRDDRKDR